MATKKLSLNELKKLVRKIVKEQMDIELDPDMVHHLRSVVDVYKTYGKKYPYAADAIVAYYFGDRRPGNIIRDAENGIYGRSTAVDPVLISQFMLDNETSWQDSEDNVKGMNEWLMNVPTKNGMTLSDYY